MTTPAFRVSRFVWLIAAVVAVGFVVYWLIGAIFPFIIGGAIAYILYPFVVWLEEHMPGRERKPGLVRSLSILIVFVAALGLVAGVFLLVIPPLTEQFTRLVESIPQLLDLARSTVEQWNRMIVGEFPEPIVQQIQEALQDAGSILLSALQGFVARTFGIVSQTLTIVIGLAAIPLFLFYVLKDREGIIDGAVGLLPPDARFHTRNVIALINRVFSNYVRAQLFLGLVVGVMAWLGLTLLGVQFAIILGVVAGIFELVPIIGPWIGAVPGIIVVLATSPDQFFWVVLLYFGIQILENTFLVPRIQSQALNVHPILILFVLIVGSEVAGLWGVILGAPLVVAAKEVFMYFSASWHSEEGVPLTEGEQRVEEIIRNHEGNAEMPPIYSEVSLSDQEKDS